MKKILLYAAIVSVLASCDIWNDGDKKINEPVAQEDGLMYFYYLDDKGADLLDFKAGEIQYPVHYPTIYMPQYKAPDKFDDIIDYNPANYGAVIGRYYSGNWSHITYDAQIGLYRLYMSMPFSNLSSENETFYVARSESDVDTVKAEIVFLTEGVIGGGPDPRYPDVQKLWYNDVLIMDKSSTGDQRTFIVKHRNGTTSVHTKTKPSPDK